jgi:hypothetical protein
MMLSRKEWVMVNKVEDLDTMASTYSGDGASPNIYFVTVQGRTQAAFVVPEPEQNDVIYDVAVAYAKHWPATIPVVVEDRLTGVCWDNPASEEMQRVEDD